MQLALVLADVELREILPSPSLHSLCELTPGHLRQVSWHGVIARLDGSVRPRKKFPQSIVHHHEGGCWCMIALVIEVGCCFCILAAAAPESSTHHTALIKAAALLLCLGQDVIRKI